MPGLLLDVNLQSHREHLERVLVELELMQFLEEKELSVATFREANLPQDLDDRALWQLCQRQQFVLFTENRNDDGPDSLQMTLDQLWRPGHLPVLTLASRLRFERSTAYAQQVVGSIADVLFGVFYDNDFRDRARIWIPF